MKNVKFKTSLFTENGKLHMEINQTDQIGESSSNGSEDKSTVIIKCGQTTYFITEYDDKLEMRNDCQIQSEIKLESFSHSIDQMETHS